MKTMRLVFTAILVIFSLILGACYELLEDGEGYGRVLTYPAANATEDLILDNVEWFKILRDVANEGGYVTLDLQKCKRPVVSGDNLGGGGLYEYGGETIFNPYYATSQGKDKILRIILPDDATAIIDAVGTPVALHTDIEGVAEEADKSAFIHFTNLRSVKGDYIKNIGNYAFYGLNKLNRLEFPRAVKIHEYAFRNCTSLTSIRLNQVDAISDYAFMGCTALSDIGFPYALSIGKRTFQECKGLTEVFLEKVTTVDDFAFINCSNLKRIALDNAVTFGTGVFEGCPDDREEIGFTSP